MITTVDISNANAALDLLDGFAREIDSLAESDWKFFDPIFGDSFRVVFCKGFDEDYQEVDAGFNDLTLPAVNLHDLSSELIEAIQESLDLRDIWHNEVYPEVWPERVSIRWVTTKEGASRLGRIKTYIQECVEKGEGLIPKFNLQRLFKGVVEHVSGPWEDLIEVKKKEYNSHFHHDWQLSSNLDRPDWKTLVLNPGNVAKDKKRIQRVADKINEYFMVLGPETFGDLRTVMQNIKPGQRGFKTVLQMLQNCEKTREFHDVYLPYVDGILNRWEAKHLTMDSYGKFRDDLVGRYVKVWDLKTDKGCEAFAEGKLPGKFEYVKLAHCFHSRYAKVPYPHLKGIFLHYNSSYQLEWTYEMLHAQPSLAFVGCSDAFELNQYNTPSACKFYDEKGVLTTNAKLMRKVFG